MENNKCLKAGQATISLKEEGVLFSVKGLLWGKKDKIIPYSNIKEVLFGPRWWIFPSLRILENGDSKFFVEPGHSSGYSFNHNQVTIPFWKYKEWEELANLIRQKIIKNT